MIDPSNLLKKNELSDGKGSIFEIQELPEYEFEDYDFTSTKDLKKYLKDVEGAVRTSFEYKELIYTLRNYYEMCRSGFSQNISNMDSTHIKIEIHHTPFTLYDIIAIVYDKRNFYHQDISVEMTSKEVMELHYKQIIGLYPLSATEHKLVHNGYLFIPTDRIWGRYDLFVNLYKDFIDPALLKTLERIEEYSKIFNEEEQKKLLTQSNIYIDPKGAYKLPEFSKIKDIMSNRIDQIKNNYYALPVFEDKDNNPMKELFIFMDK